MQKLEFESSWDKTLSHKDRKIIEDTFLETSTYSNRSIQFAPLWQAYNHRGELLITVLVHNFTQDAFSFNCTRLRYISNNKIFAECSFTLPLAIHSESSMPWTFIFPIESIQNKPTVEKGNLIIV